jgi:hypothetical protein
MSVPLMAITRRCDAALRRVRVRNTAAVSIGPMVTTNAAKAARAVRVTRR